MLDCWIKQSYSAIGKSRSVPAKPNLKCDFQDCIARSARLFLCLCGVSS